MLLLVLAWKACLAGIILGTLALFINTVFVVLMRWFRMYRQNGSLADSGALFLATSKEEDVTKGHTIVPDGYDIGR
jgi:hypothetical protein